MWKEKLHFLGNYIIKHSKVVLPAVVVVAVAVTVSVSLSMNNRHREEQQNAESVAAASSEIATEPTTEDVPLVANEEGAVYTLVATYYNAMATGDETTLRSVCDEISDKDMYRYLELAQYIDYYPTLEIYTKTGPEEGSVIAYVYYKIAFVGHEEEVPGYQALYICTNDQGEMYIKRGENSEEVNDYIKTVSTQDDVVEFNNKITVEYNELMVDHPEVLQYISELDSQVSIAVGEKLANQVAGDQNTDTSAEGGDQAADGQDTSAEGTEQPAEEQGPQYVTTTTTVNVRSSDSEQADKLGKVAGGTKLQVLEQRANGWTKVDYEGKEGYIKTEFLQLAESAAGAETIGTVTATTNINVRASASETADRLGVLSGAGNVAIYAIQKAEQLGAKVVTCSDSTGWIYDPEGIDVALLQEVKEVKRARLTEYAAARPSAQYHEKKNGEHGVWTVKCDVALPCATQNELDLEDAKQLVANGVFAVAEGANMPTTMEATEYFQKNGVLFCPGKASNAGGVATSALEMSQNSERLSWTFEEVDAKLKTIMVNIFHNLDDAAKKYGMEGNYVAGANIAGFLKVADAMTAQGIV